MPEVKAHPLPEKEAFDCPYFEQRASSGKKSWIRPEGPRPLKKPLGPANPVSFATHLSPDLPPSFFLLDLDLL